MPMRKPRTSKKSRAEARMVKSLARAIDRPDLVQVLQAQEDQRFITMLEMMHSPGHCQKGLAKLARECHISHLELTDAIRKFKLNEGIIRMSQHVPQVLEDVAIDAKSSESTCPTCYGDGTFLRKHKITKVNEAGVSEEVEVSDPTTCLKCDGTGKVRIMGDAGARKLVFESLGLTGKVAPAIDARSLTLVNEAEGLEALLKMASNRSPAPMLEATVTQTVTPIASIEGVKE